MAFLMTPPTRATLPVAEMSSVRTHTQGMLLRHRGQLVLVVSLHALAAVAALAAPRIVGLLVDTVTQQGTVATVDRLAVGLAVAVVAQTVLTWFARRSSFRMGEDLFAELREQFMDRVVSLPLSTVERAGTGDLVSRTTNDVEALSHVARFGIPSIFVAVVTVVITCVAAFLTGWMVALAIVVGFPLLWLSTRWYLRYAPAGYLRERATYAVMNGVVTESVDGARTVDALRLGRRRRARIDHAISDAYDAEMYTLRLRMWWFPQVEIAYLFPVAVTLLWGGWLVAQGQTTVGTVTAVALYVQALAMPLDELLMWLDEIQVGATSLARVIGIADVPPDRKASGETPRDGRLEVEDVRYAYRSGRDVLNGVSLDLRARGAAGHRRSVRGGQVDARAADGRHRRPTGRPGRRRRRAPGRPRARPAARRGRPRHAGAPRLRRHPRGQPAARPAGCDAGHPARRTRGGRRAGVGAGAAARAGDARRQRGSRADHPPGAAARAGPAGAGRPAYPRARRGHLAAGPARGAAPGAVAWPPSSRDVRSSPSRTVCTRRTTPTGWPWSTRASSPRSGPTTS